MYNGDVLFSWSASLEVMLWAYGLGGLNQHIFKVTHANDFPKSFYYFQLFGLCRCIQENGRSKENNDGTYYARPFATSTIAIPDNKDIADKFEEPRNL